MTPICKTCKHLSLSGVYCKRKDVFLVAPGSRRRGDKETRKALRSGNTLPMACWQGENSESE
jgi:hypothetical protein